MREMFVSKEIAYKLLEKGFDEDCLAMYNDRYWKGDLVAIGQHEGSGISGDKNSDFKSQRDYYKIATAPTRQQVIDWLLKTHNLCIHINNGYLGDDTVHVYKLVKNGRQYITDTNNTDKAIEEALKFI
jgi:hypothetical protein